MIDEQARRLFEFADLIHGIARQLRPPSDLEPGTCTPIEISVMRFIHRHPGSSARAASQATLLPTSNLSRVLRSLVGKGLIWREADTRDARVVRLYPTKVAARNFDRMRESWSQALEGIVDGPEALDAINTTLRRVETELMARTGGLPQTSGVDGSSATPTEWTASRPEDPP